MTDPSELQRGTRVGRYELLEPIGSGGMGVVWAAKDPALDRLVGIKLIDNTRTIAAGHLRLRLWREAQAMARLRHPNVVAVHDVGEAHGRLFVAMEYVDGVSLRTHLATPRSAEDILAVFRAAGEGLAAAHDEGIIHRDFKPDNVIVGRDGRVQVLDFGLAGWAPDHHADEDDADPSASLTKPGMVIGTLAYMAPEQRRGRANDARCDQYAFCVALWQALTGKLPFGRGPRACVRARIGRLADVRRKDMPRAIEQALRRGLAWQAEQRWPDMHALLEQLQPRRRGRGWPLAAAFVGAAAAELAGLAWPRVPAEARCEPPPKHDVALDTEPEPQRPEPAKHELTPRLVALP